MHHESGWFFPKRSLLHTDNLSADPRIFLAVICIFRMSHNNEAARYLLAFDLKSLRIGRRIERTLITDTWINYIAHFYDESFPSETARGSGITHRVNVDE